MADNYDSNDHIHLSSIPLIVRHYFVQLSPSFRYLKRIIFRRTSCSNMTCRNYQKLIDAI